MSNENGNQDILKFEVSQHYVGMMGEQYFEGQKRGGQISATWNLPFWKPYIDGTDSVMDFGCGGGYLLDVLSASCKVGVEGNPHAREEVRKKGITIYSDLLEIPQETKFSRIISSHALEHAPDPYHVLLSLRELLDSEGELLLLLPLDDWRNKHHRRFRLDDIHHHLFNWSPQNLGNLLWEAGFEPIAITVITDAMPPLIIAEKVRRLPLFRSFVGKITGFLLNRRQLWARVKVRM